MRPTKFCSLPVWKARWRFGQIGTYTEITGGRNNAGRFNYVTNPWVNGPAPHHRMRARQQELEFQAIMAYINWIVFRFGLTVKTNADPLVWEFALQEIRDGWDWSKQSVYRRLVDAQHEHHLPYLHAQETYLRTAMKRTRKAPPPGCPEYPGLSPNQNILIAVFVVMPDTNLQNGETLVRIHIPDAYPLPPTTYTREQKLTQAE